MAVQTFLPKKEVSRTTTEVEVASGASHAISLGTGDVFKRIFNPSDAWFYFSESNPVDLDVCEVVAPNSYLNLEGNMWIETGTIYARHNGGSAKKLALVKG